MRRHTDKAKFSGPVCKKQLLGVGRGEQQKHGEQDSGDDGSKRLRRHDSVQYFDPGVEDSAGRHSQQYEELVHPEIAEFVRDTAYQIQRN